MTQPPDFPAPTWDVTKYEYRYVGDWQHLLICRQCKALLLPESESEHAHDNLHRQISELADQMAKLATDYAELLQQAHDRGESDGRRQAVTYALQTLADHDLIGTGADQRDDND